MPAVLDPANSARRSRAAVVSLVVGLVVFALKVVGWVMTGSSAVLSDALESVVNVVAALFAIFADAHHVLSDVWTTIGVLFGLALVRFTHVVWLDPATAVVLAVVLARTGVKLVAESTNALLDGAKTEDLLRLVDAFNACHVE